MQVGYYPGCSLTSTAKDFDQSIRTILKAGGIAVEEIPDWNCCGASAAKSLSEELDMSLSYRNLANAEEAGLRRILSPCPSCYSHLKHTHDQVTHDRAAADRLEKIVGKAYKGETEAKHLLDFIKEDLGLDRLQASLKTSLRDLKVASYYGCLNRLPGVQLDDRENPVLMDEIIQVLEAEPLDWSHKSECCGASLAITRTDIALRLIQSILQSAEERGAECIAVVCPLCQSNLDTRQGDLNRRYKTPHQIPILYISQLIGLAQGQSISQLGIDRLIVNPRELLLKKEILRQ